MKFTWWTYYQAKNRIFDQEFSQFASDVQSGDMHWPYSDYMRVSILLRKRALRERGDKWYTRASW